MVIIDLETTGFSPTKDSILEIGAIKINHKFQEVSVFNSLVKPISPIPNTIQLLTGITPKMVESAPRWSEISKKVRNFIEKSRIIGWNVAFDKRFLVANDPGFHCFEYIDYLKYIRDLDYDFPNYKLRTVAKFSGVKIKDVHRALGDVYLILGIMRKFGCAS